MLQEHHENFNIAAANGAIHRSSRSKPRLNGKSGASAVFTVAGTKRVSVTQHPAKTIRFAQGRRDSPQNRRDRAERTLVPQALIIPENADRDRVHQRRGLVRPRMESHRWEDKTAVGTLRRLGKPGDANVVD